MADRFIKMHGLGNDFVVIDARDTPVTMTTARARAIADRHTGIGCDQLVLLEPSSIADLKMRIFNADGGEVEACGNATRCVATLLGTSANIESLGGILSVARDDAQAHVEMGEPRFAWEQIPLAMPMATERMPVGWSSLDAPDAVNVGNPHIVFFVHDASAIDLGLIGPEIENDPLFPQRINVGIASVDGDNRLKLRVWERGAGLTRGCGTGACASAVAAIRRKLVQSPVTVALPGGELVIAWAPGEPIRMSGPATRVFDGETDWSRFG